MRLLLLHGPAITSSRSKLSIIKKDFDPSDVMIYDQGSDLGQIKVSLMTMPLLSEQRLVILENPSEDFTDYTLTPNPYTLIFWFSHEVSDKKPIMGWVKENKGQILFFPEGREVSVFPFLDMLANGDKKAFLELTKLKNAGFDIQYFITMVFYLLRNLAVTPRTAPQFVKEKLTRQRKNFSVEGITSLYKGILEIDFKIKSGLLDINQAEFSLVNKFILQENV